MRVLFFLSTFFLAGMAQAFTEAEEERGRRACALVAAMAVDDTIVVQDVSARTIFGLFYEVTLGFSAGGTDGQTAVCKLVIKEGEPNLTGTKLNGEDIPLLQNSELHLALKAAFTADNDLPQYAIQ